MISKVVGLYFSPSGATAKITKRITHELANRIDCECVDSVVTEYHDMLRNPLASDLSFDDETIVVIGFPAYNGRIPLPCVKMMQRLHGNDTLTIAVVAYGNSSYGDSLYELYTFAEEQGFNVVSAAAFVTQHALFTKIAESRPDEEDLRKLLEFCDISANKMKRFCGTFIKEMRSRPAPLEIRGSMPSKNPLKIPIHPTVNNRCVKCGACVEICPVDAIDPHDPRKIDPKKCISCSACVKVCQYGAKGYFGPMYTASRLALEKLYNKRKDPEWFI